MVAVTARILPRALALAAALALLANAGAARAERPKRVEVSASSDIYAGLPFTLLVVVDGFAEDPAPTLSDLEIPGCQVSYLGMQPSISSQTVIRSGRRTDTREVRFVYRYRVVAPKPGAYQVPALTASQGPDKAASPPATFRASEVAGTRDMRIELTLPDRPVTVGETFDVTLDWYLRKTPEDHDIAVPLFDEVLWMDVQQPQLSPIAARNALEIQAGDRKLTLPFVQEDKVVDGVQYTRVRVVATVTPIKAGTIEVAPARVVARLLVGKGRDSFGFSTARTELFKAEDKPRTLEIQPLPLEGRPASFANAVGTAFSIQVRAERTVVKLGEPVELDIVVRGDGRLEGLVLPKLDHPGGLSASEFSIPDTTVTGELVDLGQDSDQQPIKGKRFRVTARVISPNVREIPPIAFSYYNPKTRSYETAHSDRIALSVEGSAIVGADQVVSATAKSADAAPAAGAPRAGLESLVGADLSTSALSRAMVRPWSVSGLGALLYVLYGVPLLILFFRVWQLGSRARRDEKSVVRKALGAARRALDEAKTAPAREAGPKVLSALRALAKAAGHDGVRHREVIERIEVESYSQKAGQEPLAAATVREARALAESLAADARSGQRSGQRAQTAAAGALMLLACAAGSARAEVPADAPEMSQEGGQGGSLEAARAAYQRALAEADVGARTAAFARAERMLRHLAESAPESPEILTDWGNAALGAQDLGRAVLGYRRALAASPRHARARQNLTWVRERLPDWLPKPNHRELSDSLFFWHHNSTLAERHAIAALSFAAAILLIVPWGRRQRLLRRLAILPAVVWVAMMVSIALYEPPVRDAVVMRDDTPVLSADNPGAPPTLAKPLPAGAEVTVLETRDAWTRVALADGTAGWVQASAIERVLP